MPDETDDHWSVGGSLTPVPTLTPIELAHRAGFEEGYQHAKLEGVHGFEEGKRRAHLEYGDLVKRLRAENQQLRAYRDGRA